MNGELFEIMVIRLPHTPSDPFTENSIKLFLTLELIFLDHGLIIVSIFLYLDHGLLFWWILIPRISGIRFLHSGNSPILKQSYYERKRLFVTGGGLPHYSATKLLWLFYCIQGKSASW